MEASTKREIGKAAKAIILTSLAGSAAATGINRAYDFIKLRNDQDAAYKKMFTKVPQLKEYDKELVDDYYGIVKSFAPHMAANPYVAGSIVNKMILNEGVDHRLVGEIAEISSNIGKPKNEFASQVLGATAKPFIPGPDFLFPKKHGEGIEHVI